MNTKELLEYNIDEMLFTSFLVENHSMNVMETDPETGDYIIDGKLVSEISEDSDETYGFYHQQFREKRNAFMETLDKYIDEKIEVAINGKNL